MSDQNLQKNEQTTTSSSQIPFDVRVMVQPTPNPSAYKFIVNREVKATGKITYNSADECHNNDLGRALFDIPSVLQLHFFENVITVTFKPDTNLLSAEDDVIDVIKRMVVAHDPNFHVDEDEAVRRAALSPEIREIEEILDRTIRPGLQGDGGDIEVISLVDNELSVRYQGACGSCPSSSQGTLMAIEGILREQFDPDIRVLIV